MFSDTNNARFCDICDFDYVYGGTCTCDPDDVSHQRAKDITRLRDLDAVAVAKGYSCLEHWQSTTAVDLWEMHDEIMTNPDRFQ